MKEIESVDMFAELEASGGPVQTQFERYNEIIDESGLDLSEILYNDVTYLGTLSAKEYLLHKKYNELLIVSSKYSDPQKFMKNKTMNFEDVKYCMENDDNEVEIELCHGSKSKTDEWKLMRYFISSSYYQVGGGRNLNYIIKINGKYAGIISLTSDIISIGCRDRFIGWKPDMKHRNLGKIGIGSTIVPVQPLGYFCTGGKLLSLMFYSAQIRNDWEEKYGEKLTGCTTTSLYGINSQYNGMKKYWKPLGETEGSFVIFPSDDVYEKIKEWIKVSCDKNRKLAAAYKKLFHVTNKSGMVTNVKAKNMGFFLKNSGYREKYKDNKKDLTIGYKRGVYFSRFYNNTLDYLLDNIGIDELIPRDTLDFNIDKPGEIFAYWKRKWAKNRFERLSNEDGYDRSQFYMSILNEKHDKDIITEQEFMKKYG